jgi:hypothetical protein
MSVSECHTMPSYLVASDLPCEDSYRLPEVDLVIADAFPSRLL